MSLAVAPIELVQDAIEAEQALIGCVLNDNGAFVAVTHIGPERFREPFHAAIWEVMAEAIRTGHRAEPMLIKGRLQHHPAFADVGGVRYLADMVDMAPPSERATHYADLVTQAWARRVLAEIALEARRAALAGGDPAGLIAGLREQLERLELDAAPGDDNLIGAKASAFATLDEIETEAEHGRPKGLMTGLRCIDRRLRGFRPGHLVVIAGRPSMGKTALARQAAHGCARRNPHHQVVFFALEMARRELDERTLSELSHEAGDGVAYQDMSGDKLTPLDRRALRELAYKIPPNFIIDDCPTLSIDYVRRRVWALKRKGPVGVVFIDYLQIMDRPDAAGRNDAAIIGQMTKALKQLARQAGICIVLLSQINRGVESRDDKRPQLSDLRESGAIEQDANAVLFPFREFYYVERAEPRENSTEHAAWEQNCELLRRRMDVLCPKNRQGAVGYDRQVYFAECDRVVDDREERQ